MHVSALVVCMLSSGDNLQIFLLSIMWVQGIELGLPYLETSAFAHWVINPHFNGTAAMMSSVYHLDHVPSLLRPLQWLLVSPRTARVPAVCYLPFIFLDLHPPPVCLFVQCFARTQPSRSSVSSSLLLTEVSASHKHIHGWSHIWCVNEILQTSSETNRYNRKVEAVYLCVKRQSNSQCSLSEVQLLETL